MAKLRAHKGFRTQFVMGIIFMCLFCVCVQASRLQIDARAALQALSAQSSVRNYTLGYVRGDIFDRNGEILATSVAVDSIIADTRDIPDIGGTTHKLSKALLMDYEELNLLMENMRNSSYVKRHVTEAESEAVRKLKLPGVSIHKEYTRSYPNGSLASHILGFVGYDGVGLEGLEMALDDKLVAEKMSVKVKRDNRSRIIMDNPGQVISQPKGASVMLTLDLRIQHIAERAIKEAVSKYNAVAGMVLVVDPKNGDVLASASFPTYDPNYFTESLDTDRRNRVLTDPFEPGSTMKIFTVAAALQEEKISPDSVFFCENGLYLVDGKWPIRDTGVYGDLTVKQIIQKSSNICASKIGDKLGPEKLHHYLSMFGFGQKTGLSYPAGEDPGLLHPPKKWHVLDAWSIAFGQGLSVTALQLAMAASSLANDGHLMRPSIVSRVIDPDGRVIESRPQPLVRKVVSPVVAQYVLGMMRMVAMKDGTGRRGEIKEYPIAAKTGTAQMVITGQKSYSSDKYVASFVGVAPYENPRLCVLVVLNEPKPSHHGGVVAAPVFKEIMSQALPLLDVPPYDSEVEVQPRFPTVRRAAPGAPGIIAAENASYNYLKVDIAGSKGDGPIPEFPDEPSRQLEFDELAPPDALETVVSESDDGEILSWGSKMPDVAGMTMRETLDALSRHGLALEYEGSGVAEFQEPAKGVVVAKGEVARVRFKPVSP